MPYRYYPGNTNKGASYAVTYNSISEDNKVAMLSNTLRKFTKDTQKWEITGAALKEFTLTPDSAPFQNKYTNYGTDTSDTRMYYVIRSYLEQLEKAGGTLTLSAGTYDITNALHVPSHVTIYLKDGAVLRKKEKTGTSQLKSAKAMFHLAAPFKPAVIGAYSGYGGDNLIRVNKTYGVYASDTLKYYYTSEYMR